MSETADPRAAEESVAAADRSGGLAYLPRYGHLSIVANRAAYLLLLCAFLYGAMRNQSWGLPESWPSDEVSWIVDGMLARDSLNPTYFLYPSLAIYLGYIPSRLAMWFLGDLDDAARQYLVGTICRTVSALAFVGTCITIERLCAMTFGVGIAFFALITVGLNSALLHHAHIGTVNSVFFLTIALALYCLVRVTMTGRLRDVYLAAAVCGLAVGAKYNAAFLCAGVPFAYALARRPLRVAQFIGHMTAAGVISIVVFVLTTPFAVLDWPGFREDMTQLIVQEGPAFKTPMPVLGYLWKLWADCLGFFSPPGLVLFSGLAVAGLVTSALEAAAVRRVPLRQVTKQSSDVFRIEMLLVALLSVFLIMNFQIGIFQSRYSIPGVVVFLCIGLVAWYTITEHLRPWPRICFVTRTCVALPLVFVFSVSAYVHVEAFKHSAKAIAGAAIRQLLAADPEARVGVVGYPRRSPFALQAADGRVDVFMTMVAEHNVESWDEYLQVIASYFEQRSPTYIVLEDIMFAWTVLLPQKYASDYAMRLAYPNPGHDAWNRMFASIGYEPKATFSSKPFPDWVYMIIGDWHRVTIEGVGTNSIFLYWRCGLSCQSSRSQIRFENLSGGAAVWTVGLRVPVAA